MDKQYHSRQLRLTESGFLASQIASSKSGECPYTLFLGAGASLSSGIPHVNDLIHQWKIEIFDNLSRKKYKDSEKRGIEFKKWENEKYKDWLSELKYYLHSNSDYGTLFQHTRKTREERQMYVERLIEGKFPSPGYMYLAGLIEAGKINRILTTNFDDLLNDSLVSYYGIKSINCAFDSAVTSFNNSSLRPKIIKLHGDFLYDNVRNTDDELLDLGENMEGKMIEMCEDKGLIVVGYSGNDESIMSPIRENLRKNKKFLTKGIHWCLYMPRSEDNVTYIQEDMIPENLRIIRKRYPDRVFLYSINSFDTFMENAFEKSGLDLPKTIREPYQNNVANQFLTACEVLENGETISPLLRQHMDEAEACMENTPDTNQLKIRRARAKWRYGKHLRDTEGDFENAILNFEESKCIIDPILKEKHVDNILKLEALTRKLGCHLGISKSLFSLNKPYIEEMDKAYSVVQEAIKIEPTLTTDKEYEILASIFYNTICALGVKSTLSKKVTDDTKKRVQEIVGKLNTTRVGRSKIEKLKGDSDTNLIRDLLEY